MYRSVAVPAQYKRGSKKDTPTEEAKFLELLQADLARFGRADSQYAKLADTAVFVWSTLYNQPASSDFRKDTAKARLAVNASTLEFFEAAHPELFSAVFDLDTHSIAPEIVPCKDDPGLNRIFDYYLFRQSLESSVNRGRFGRFLVYDGAVACRPLMGIIGLSSAVYFNGARDAALGWMATGRREGKRWVKNQAAQARRDHGLLSLSHITAATLVPPYSESLKLGRLLSSLCFSEPVIDFMEARYKRPITALTTTGGWGGSAGSYQRIRLRQTPSGARHLFTSLESRQPSLNQRLDYFSGALFVAAFEMHRVSSCESSARFKDFAREESVREELFRWALEHLGLPRAAAYVNRVSHYLGAVSDDGIRYLSKGARGRIPVVRKIPIVDALNYWRSENERVRLPKVRQLPLSEGLASGDQGPVAPPIESS